MKIIYVVAFKLCWLALVYWQYLLMLPVLLYWGFAMLRLHHKARLAVLLLTLCGVLLDSVLVASGWLNFAGNTLLPIWMMVLWACFALMLVQVLADLLRYWWLAALFGAVGGPLAYWGGSVLGGELLYQPVLELSLLLALCWSLLMAVFVHYRFLWSNQHETLRIDAKAAGR